jgi:hypothetical protein
MMTARHRRSCLIRMRMAGAHGARREEKASLLSLRNVPIRPCARWFLFGLATEMRAGLPKP